jgi:hypothetical protein
MQSHIGGFAVLSLALTAVPGVAADCPQNQTGNRVEGTVTRPLSSIEKPGDAGIYAHTPLEIFTPPCSPSIQQPPPKTFYDKKPGDEKK